MRNKKILVFLSCCLVLILWSSVSSYAYYPVITVESSDWTVPDGDIALYTSSNVYPRRVPFAGNDSVYQYPDLNGQTYFYASSWIDDFPLQKSSTVTFPDLPVNYNQYSSRAVFKCGNTFVFVASDDEYNLICLDSNNNLGFYGGIDGAYICIYTLTYPFTEWVLYSEIGVFDELGKHFGWLSDDLSDPFEVIWSDNTIYRYNGSSHAPLKEADTWDFNGYTDTVTYSEPISVTVGAVSLQLTSDDVARLRSGAYCMRIQDLGFVAGTLTTMCAVSYRYRLYLGDNIIAEGSVFGEDSQYEYMNVSNLNSLAPGQRVLNDYVHFMDIGKDPVAGETYTLNLAVSYFSDGYNLFFPGKFELIEFESYSDDIKHEEMQSAIYEAADIVSGSVDSAKSEISSEIAEAAGEITSSVNEGTAAITGTITTESKSIKEKIADAADTVKDKLQSVGTSIENKLEDVKNGLLEGLKKLFIPDEEAVTAIKDEYDEVFSERFGALYQVSQIIQNFASKLKYSGETGIITIPKVNLAFDDAQYTVFTFGGYEVNLIPDERLEILTTTLKVITSIACTFLFVNTLKRKYDKLVGDDE